ncbi:MAG TPA: ABC transporter substrate-binding protein/permease [Gemmataceae bacterium]|nr:ABC transporter substrate-binding protein/permease [Gemmataceae bacterium]
MEEFWFRCRRLLPAAGALFLLAVFQPLAHAADSLVWAADAEGGAPYIFKDPDNPQRDIGFEVDLANALANQLGRTIEFKQYEYISLFLGLDRGDFDFAMNGLEVTSDRKGRYRFSRPYYIYKQQLVVRADEERFKTLEECKAADCVIGTLEETAAERLLDRLGVRKHRYQGQVEPYRDLQLARNVDGVLLDLPIALYHAKPNPKLKFAGEPRAKGYYAIAFSKHNESLAAEFDSALDRLLKNGELRRIYEKWQLWNDDQDELLLAQITDITSESSGPWPLARYFPLLAEAAWVTVAVTVLSFALAVVIALPIALSRMYGPAPLRWLALGHVEFFRGIPVLLLLVFLYFGLPSVSEHYALPLSLKLSAFQAAILGFGLNYSAYEAEIYRAGIGSIPRGQWEAAASLGMSSALTFRRIILPQALRTVLPPMTNDFVALFKDTSVVSVIAVVELTKEYSILAKNSGDYVGIGLATAALYLIMSVPLGYLSRYLERRWSKAIAT